VLTSAGRIEWPSGQKKMAEGCLLEVTMYIIIVKQQNAVRHSETEDSYRPYLLSAAVFGSFHFSNAA